MKRVSSFSFIKPLHKPSNLVLFHNGAIIVQSLPTVWMLTSISAIPTSAVNITKPVLLLTASKDPIGTPGRAENSTRPFALHFRAKSIDSGHFMMLEKANEVNEALRDFFESSW